MSTPILTAAELDGLRRYNTPTISNAIELFNVRPRHLGFLPHTIRCLLPDLGPIVGYAVTSQTRAATARADRDRRSTCWATTSATSPSLPGPKIAVGQDLDDPPGLGAQFGEVTATIHQKLGCVGHITSGCPRDLDEVEALGFQLFGLNPCVSHAYVRLVDFGKPVMIGGVEITARRPDPRRQARRLLDPPSRSPPGWPRPAPRSSAASGRCWRSAAPTTSPSRSTSSSTGRPAR